MDGEGTVKRTQEGEAKEKPTGCWHTLVALSGCAVWRIRVDGARQQRGTVDKKEAESQKPESIRLAQLRVVRVGTAHREEIGARTNTLTYSHFLTYQLRTRLLSLFTLLFFDFSRVTQRKGLLGPQPEQQQLLHAPFCTDLSFVRYSHGLSVVYERDLGVDRIDRRIATEERLNCRNETLQHHPRRNLSPLMKDRESVCGIRESLNLQIFGCYSLDERTRARQQQRMPRWTRSTP